MLARGHCLLEGVSGLARTMVIRGLARIMDLTFRRIRFTPDLTPADITGMDIIQEEAHGRRSLVFQPGPIFAQMILADEINRTPPKTQVALLEAMQEHAVTVGNHTYPLREPFFVLATQNPIEQEGTYPLPEAQRDRFMFHVGVDYPTRDQEREIIARTTGVSEIELSPVMTGEQILAGQQIIRAVPGPEHVTAYVLDLVRRCRPSAAVGRSAPAIASTPRGYRSTLDDREGLLPAGFAGIESRLDDANAIALASRRYVHPALVVFNDPTHATLGGGFRRWPRGRSGDSGVAGRDRPRGGAGRARPPLDSRVRRDRPPGRLHDAFARRRRADSLCGPATPRGVGFGTAIRR